MTLVAGFMCKDGFVIAADTEMTVGSIIVQGSKIAHYSGEGSHFYSVVIGGAGDVNYIRMASQTSGMALRDCRNLQWSISRAK